LNAIKTAISIDAKTYGKINRMIRRLHISRSSFFTQAAQYMIAKDENIELLHKINASYREDTRDIERIHTEKEYVHRKVVDRW
jgi:metal-responsive CopG/Arc/MetJ family transcriptional regulator